MEILFSVNNHLKMYGCAFFEFSNFNALRKRGHRKVRIIHRMGGAFSLTNRYFVQSSFNFRCVKTLSTVFANLFCSSPSLYLPLTSSALLHHLTDLYKL